MRKLLKNKKGFTLVELMIVVVIMGILVAVAIPIYNSVTKGVEKRACEANVRILEENFNSYAMTGNEGDAVKPADLVTQFDGKKFSETPPEYRAMIKEADNTKCPTDDSDYTFEVEDKGDGTYSFSINCATADHAAPAAGEGA